MVVVVGLEVVVGRGHQGWVVVEVGVGAAVDSGGEGPDEEEPPEQPALSGQSQRSCASENGYH